MKTREPKWDGGVPWCTEDKCPMYDGKRCEESGFRPDQICEPQVKEMGAALYAIAAYPPAPETQTIVQIARRAAGKK